MTINELMKELQKAEREYGRDIEVKVNPNYVALDGVVEMHEEDGKYLISGPMRIAEYAHVVEYGGDTEPKLLIW